MAKKSGIHLIFVVLLASLLIAFFWEKIPAVKDAVHTILNPIILPIFSWNLTWGMILLVAFITIIITLVQKYATDQVTLKSIKEENKKIQLEMKQHKNDAGKSAELMSKNLKLSWEMMQHSMRPIIFTGIPLVLLFRWFIDYFSAIPDFRFFGIFSWLWFYLILSLVFSPIFRKLFKVH